MLALVALLLAQAGSAPAPSAATHAAPAQAAAPTQDGLAVAATRLALPAPGPISMDYLAADGRTVWVPAGNTGKVFVLDVKSGKFRSVDGFATKKGRGDRLMGPSSVSVGDGMAYVGNRGDNSVCAIDTKTLEKRGCATMPSMPDGTVYVATTHEVWVTTPRDNAFQIVDVKDAAAPKIVGTLAVDGPEGYAVDVKKGLLYTNLEEKDKTLAIDVKARKVVSTWESGCGKDGPRGLSVDAPRGLLVVACATAGLNVLSTKDGAKKGHLDTGNGVDNIDMVSGMVYAAAGRDAKLTVAKLGDDGSLRAVSTSEVGKGARVVVADSDGTAYAADSQDGQLWVVKPGAQK